MKPQTAFHPRVRSSRLLLAFAVLVLLALVAAPIMVAHANTITVNDTSGTTGGPGCTLRDAISAANMDAPAGACPAGAGADTITLPAGATITLTEPDNGDATEVNGLPPITSTITINGNNAIIERSSAAGTPAFRIFAVFYNSSLTLNSVTVRNGKTSVDTNGNSGNGGGIQAKGFLFVNNSTITGNSTGDSSLGAGSGGGISGEHGPYHMAIMNSTISGNRTGSSASGMDGHGGGISTRQDYMIMENSTISGNTATGPSGSGGGIYVQIPLRRWYDVRSSTITGNTAATGGGMDLMGSSGRLYLGNTIIALNNGSVGLNCNGGPYTLGNNIDSGTSCNWGTTNGSMSNTDPRLGPLANNGGPTWTHALLPGSPAIDGVTYNASNLSLSTDQRGVARPQFGAYDIGAFEFDGIKTLLPLLIQH